MSDEGHDKGFTGQMSDEGHDTGFLGQMSDEEHDTGFLTRGQVIGQSDKRAGKRLVKRSGKSSVRQEVR